LPPLSRLFRQDAAAQFAILLAATLVVSALGTGGFITVISMFADIVDETELRTGRRSEGLLLAAAHFLEKLSTGMAIAVPGVMLALVGFPRHADLATLDPRVMRELAFVSLALGVVLSVASTCMLFFYRIDRQRADANLAQLEGRGHTRFRRVASGLKADTDQARHGEATHLAGLGPRGALASSATAHPRSIDGGRCNPAITAGAR
jgi:Na+/melibiose symporter-like transporter